MSIAPIDYLERLPEGCIIEIISKTTPSDAVKSTILSKEFKRVVESDLIWGRYLPFGYQEIVDRSEFPPICNTKKELFFSLCDSPILLDGGKLSFFLDKQSGKKCVMLSSRELMILECGKTYFWQWKKHPNSSHIYPKLEIRWKKEALDFETSYIVEESMESTRSTHHIHSDNEKELDCVTVSEQLLDYANNWIVD
ncbi:hypothetical protein H5410_062062 [Solanum commersonii]|uniref:F-box domain-containing protein n=1 Tax=Solanum commersonii TaxID=4109 RepID=A0A9J5WB43_SOLCO|nr:hypothetical protein H5410_062062 [Solanum commersonii]